MILGNLQNVFDVFNNATAQIAEKGDYDDYENKYVLVIKGSVKGDLQPYSGDLAEKDYGLHEECQYRFFCAAHDDVKAGNCLIIDGKSYMIVYTSPWELGLEVVLKEAGLNDRCEQDSQGNS